MSHDDFDDVDTFDTSDKHRDEAPPEDATRGRSALPASVTIPFREACAYTGLSRNTFYRLLDDGLVPGAQKLGGQWRFHREKLLRWLACEEPSPARSRRSRRRAPPESSASEPARGRGASRDRRRRSTSEGEAPAGEGKRDAGDGLCARCHAPLPAQEAAPRARGPGAKVLRCPACEELGTSSKERRR